MIETLALAQQLIRCASVTPADAGAQGVLAAALTDLGFTLIPAVVAFAEWALTHADDIQQKRDEFESRQQ